MRKFITLLFVTVFSITTISAQKKVMQKLKASAESFIKQPLLVVLKDVEDNKGINEKFNEYLIQATESEWVLNVDIEFIDESSFKKLNTKNGSEISFIIHDNINGVEAFYYGVSTDKKSFHTSYFEFNEDRKLVDFYKELQASQFLIEAYSNYSFQKMSMKEAKAKMAEHAKQSTIIKENTLYIDKETLAQGVEDEIRSTYKYEFKIVDGTEINDAIINNDTKVYYLTKGGVLSADTGKLIIVLGIPDSKVVVNTPVSAFKTEKITKKDIETFVKLVN